ncbi:MAG: hypothetical protein M1833_006686 [Piccolia ochrophora]|nr:MAG: hypothetical protein M1833_006686 [Piccolia ochrophora]
MTSNPTLASRVRGSILGVAVTDALGGPVEFKKRGSFPLVTSFLPNANFGLPPGAWTDDTSMTLCLAESLIQNAGIYIPQTAIRAYIAWSEKGHLSSTDNCFDMGIATRTALTAWSKFFTNNPSLSPSDHTAHLPGQAVIDRLLKIPSSCGNGALMRVSPIALVYHKDIHQAEHVAALSAAPTHPYPTNAEACVLYTRLLVRSLHGSGKTDLVQEVSSFAFEDEALKERFDGYDDLSSWQAKPSEAISSSGYVVHTLEAALWAFFTTSTFREGAVKVVNLGAVYGGLAGAFYGLEAIPSEWIEGLRKRGVVEGIAEELVKLATNEGRR